MGSLRGLGVQCVNLCACVGGPQTFGLYTGVCTSGKDLEAELTENRPEDIHAEEELFWGEM